MRNQSYNSFWQRIHKSAKNKGIPLRVMFELTYRCNFFCRHCYVPLSYRSKSEKEELGTKGIFTILEQLKDMGCFYLGFTGGEPFMRKDFMKILWRAKKLGFEIIVYTNGSLIDKEIAEELAALRPNKVDITIPAMSKESFEKISGVVGSRDKVFKAIELLHKNRFGLGFKSCVLNDNETEIRQIRDFTNSLSAQHRLDDMLSPRLDGSKEPFNYRGKLTHKLVTSTDSNNLEKYDSLNLNNTINNTMNAMSTNNSISLFECGAGRSQAAITPAGELKICLEIDYPKYRILGSSLKDAWKRLKKLVASIKSDDNYQCADCEFKPYCHWCPARSWLEYRNFTSCDPESRGRAKLYAQAS